NHFTSPVVGSTPTWPEVYRLSKSFGSPPSAVRAQPFHGAGLPAPIMIVLLATSKLALCQGAPPPRLQASALPVGLFGSSGQDGALMSPVGVLSLPFRRPMCPSTDGRIHS